MATIIALEGLDASFKETNSKLLLAYFKEIGKKAYLFSFPNYPSESSYFVRRYLAGSYKNGPKNTTYDECCTRALHYAMDRYDTFYKEGIWELLEDEDAIIIFDRYSFSNRSFQSASLRFTSDHKTFLKSIYDLEHVTMKLPVPDLTIFMDTPIEEARKIIAAKEVKDIHELDLSFQEKVYGNAKFIIGNLEKDIVICHNYNEEFKRLLTWEEIFDQVVDIVKSNLPTIF